MYVWCACEHMNIYGEEGLEQQEEKYQISHGQRTVADFQ